MMLQQKPHQNAEFTHLLHMLPALHMEHGPWITGGSARRLWQGEDWHQGDVDVFFVNDQQRVAWLKEFDKIWNYTYHKREQPEPQSVYDVIGCNRQSGTRKHVPQAHIHVETDNATTFELNYTHEDQITSCKLQLIKVRHATSLQELWQTFDFHVCCFAADDVMVYADVAAVQDVENHEITVRHHAHSKTMPLRVFKHFSQGFHVHDDLLKQAMRQIAEKDVDWCSNY